MTGTKTIAVKKTVADHLQIFETFLHYWNVKSTNMYNDHDAFFKEIGSYSNLDSNWRFNRWNLDELENICSKIDEGLEELNPNNFF